MRIDTTSLRSKVARRIFVLFVLCALVPIAALAILSFTQVTSELQQQSQQHLRQAARATGTAVFERLMLLESQMQLLAPALAPRGARAPSLDAGEAAHLRFRGLTLWLGDGRAVSIAGA